jgi:hypothetical protein
MDLGLLYKQKFTAATINGNNISELVIYSEEFAMYVDSDGKKHYTRPYVLIISEAALTLNSFDEPDLDTVLNISGNIDFDIEFNGTIFVYTIVAYKSITCKMIKFYGDCTCDMGIIDAVSMTLMFNCKIKMAYSPSLICLICDYIPIQKFLEYCPNLIIWHAGAIAPEKQALIEVYRSGHYSGDVSFLINTQNEYWHILNEDACLIDAFTKQLGTLNSVNSFCAIYTSKDGVAYTLKNLQLTLWPIIAAIKKYTSNAKLIKNARAVSI